MPFSTNQHSLLSFPLSLGEDTLTRRMELIGVPFDLSGKTLGSRLGPAAIRLAGITETLGKLGIPLKDGADIPVLAPSETQSLAGGLRNFHAALDCVRTLKARVRHTLGSGDFPLVVGGDHVIALGAVAGALKAYGDDLAGIWIDAHADINTPSPPPSGGMHCMAVAGR